MRFDARRIMVVAAGVVAATLALTPAAHAAGSSSGTVTPAQKITAGTHGTVSPAVSCSAAWHDGDSTSKVFNHTDANARSGPSTTCSANGHEVLNGNTVYYDCYTAGDDPGTGYSTWTHLGYYINNVRYNGFVNDGLLPTNADGLSHGSLVVC